MLKSLRFYRTRNLYLINLVKIEPHIYGNSFSYNTFPCKEFKNSMTIARKHEYNGGVINGHYENITKFKDIFSQRIYYSNRNVNDGEYFEWLKSNGKMLFSDSEMPIYTKRCFITHRQALKIIETRNANYYSN